MARILVIEDDAAINDVVTKSLERAGHKVVQAFSGSEARLVLQAGGAGSLGAGAGFDVVVTDLMLPGISGEELVSLIRAHDAAMPVIVISARTTAADKVSLLKLGADDYLTKPFDLDELVARVEVQLRHRGTAGPSGEKRAGAGADGTAGPAARPLTWQRWTLDPEARTLAVVEGEDGEPGGTVLLTKIEFNILELLVRRPNKVFFKAELFELAWGEPFAGDDSTVAVHVSNIRAKLRATGTDGYIRTVWGMGFKLQ